MCQGQTPPAPPRSPTHFSPSLARTTGEPPPPLSLARPRRPDTHHPVPSPPPLLPNQHAPSPLHHPLCPKNVGESSPFPCLTHSSPCPLISPMTHSSNQELTPEVPALAVHRAAQKEEEKVQCPSGSRRVPRRHPLSFLSLLVSLCSSSLHLTPPRPPFAQNALDPWQATSTPAELHRRHREPRPSPSTSRTSSASPIPPLPPTMRPLTSHEP